MDFVRIKWWNDSFKKSLLAWSLEIVRVNAVLTKQLMYTYRETFHRKLIYEVCLLEFLNQLEELSRRGQELQQLMEVSMLGPVKQPQSPPLTMVKAKYVGEKMREELMEVLKKNIQITLCFSTQTNW